MNPFHNKLHVSVVFDFLIILDWYYCQQGCEVSSRFVEQFHPLPIEEKKRRMILVILEVGFEEGEVLGEGLELLALV